MFARLAPKLVDMGWKGIHPIKNPGKRPEVTRWERFKDAPASEKLLAFWVQKYAESGVGLVIGADKVVVFDQDIMDPQLSVRAREIYEETIGPIAMEQIGEYPKRKIYARHDGSVTLNGRSFGGHEIYLHSGQVALFTVHPGTLREYWWPDATPLDLSPEDLPLLTQSQVDNYRAAMTELSPKIAVTDGETERAYAGVEFDTWSSDRSHGWAAAALVTFRERAPEDPRIVATEMVASAPNGNRHYMAVGAVIALAMEGYSDKEIETAVAVPYLGRFRWRKDKGNRDRAIYSALRWARDHIGEDQADIDAVIDPDEIMGHWQAAWWID